MQGERVAHRALGSIGRDSVNFAHIAQTVLQRDEPFGLNAVVVGEQDDHAAYCGKDAGKRTSERFGRSAGLVSRARAKV